MVWAFPILLATLGTLLILSRSRFAQAQSNLAGGRVTPGCVVAEGVVFLLAAISAVAAALWS